MFYIFYFNMSTKLSMYHRDEPSTSGANKYTVEVTSVNERSLDVRITNVPDNLFYDYELDEGSIITDVLKPYDKNNELSDKLTRDRSNPEDKTDWDYIAIKPGCRGR